MFNKISFTKFRNAKNLDIHIGKNLTVIAGQNGTMKSTLLACIGQPFGITRNQTKEELIDVEDCKISNSNFKTHINKIFKFSDKFDKGGDHEYEIFFTDKLPEKIIYENPLQVKSFDRSDNGKLRIVTGKRRDGGKGNIPIPTVYLGLSRLYPIGESEVKSIETNLSEEEKKFLIKNYKKILLNYNEEYQKIESITKNKEKTIGINTKKYDWQAISAGQDNVGKIITTILEFKRLKKKLGKKYYGGILLIDEIESTLYPASQIELLSFLNKHCSELDLKIAFTTHSLEILKECLTNEVFKYHTKINFLDNTHGKLVNHAFFSYDDILRNLMVIPQEKQQYSPKIKIYTEDDEGEWLLKKLLTNNMKNHIEIVSLKLGFAHIAKVNLRIKEINDGIICYDKDVQKSFETSKKTSDLKKDMQKADNYSFLPGKASIEEDFIEIIKSKSPEDDFWEKNNLHNCYQVALKELSNYTIENRDSRKDWFHNNKKNYGRDGKNIFNEWKAIYKEDIDRFINEFRELLIAKFLKIYGQKIKI